jgi:2,5-diamino-6-(ribosylamino)-4(3H)-pyrimidinone 5'-phosphate reductase
MTTSMNPSARPYVVLHVAVSLDGATTGFIPDLAAFYALVRTWKEDATLTGADTILAQEPALRSTPGPGPNLEGPLLAVVDSRRRVSAWRALRDAGHWSRVIALRGDDSTPTPPGASQMIVGQDRVDLPSALHRLHFDHGVEVVRVDSGGQLAGAMLDQHLIDEVSLVIHPGLVRASAKRWFGGHSGDVGLEPIGHETLDEGLLWIRYHVCAPTNATPGA